MSVNPSEASDIPAINLSNIQLACEDGGNVFVHGYPGDTTGWQASTTTGVLSDDGIPGDNMTICYNGSDLKTRPGYSGAPVLDQLWRAIGVHRAGGRVCYATSLAAIMKDLDAKGATREARNKLKEAQEAAVRRAQEAAVKSPATARESRQAVFPLGDGGQSTVCAAGVVSNSTPWWDPL